MAENFYTMLTIVGKNKLSSSAVSGSKVNFKTLKLGDGKGAYYEPSENQTSLVNEVWEGNISSISIDENNSNWIVVETVIPASDGGFFIREAGIFDEDGDMIAISKLAETYKPVVAEGSTKDLVIRIVLEVLNVDTVTIKIDPNVVAATKNDVQVLEAKFEDLKKKVSNDVISNSTIDYGMNSKITNSGETSMSPKFTIQGKTLINLLGKDGNCEDVSKWGTGNTSHVLDSTKKVFGINSIKATIVTSGLTTREYKYLPILDTSKYYLISAYILNGNSSNGVKLHFGNGTGGSDVLSNYVADTTKFTRVGIVVKPSDFGTASTFLGLDCDGSTGQYFNYDGVMINQITSDEYALGATALLANYPYVDSYTCLQNPYIEVRHDNLVRNGNGEEGVAWWGTQNYATLSILNNKFQLVTTQDGWGSVQNIKLKPNTNYYLSGNVSGATQIYINRDANYGGGIYRTGAGVFNTGNDDSFYLYVYNAKAGTGTADSIMLIEGTTAPNQYLPCRVERVVLETKLTSDDSITYENGEVTGLINWKHKTLYGKDYDWQFGMDYTGYKRLLLASSTWNSIPDGSHKATKYTGDLLLNSGAVADATFFSSDSTQYYLQVADTDTGWTETILPNADEVKAFMNGWKTITYLNSRYVSWVSIVDGSVPSGAVRATISANTSGNYLTVASGGLQFSNGDYIVVLTVAGGLRSFMQISGTPTDTNIPLSGSTGAVYSGDIVIKADNGTTNTSLLNWCKNNVANGYDGYQLHYKLQNPEPITDDNCHIHGDIPKFDVGDNYLYLDSGGVIGEVANPVIGSIYTCINDFSSGYKNDILKNKTEDIYGIYKNNIYDSIWGIDTINSYGNKRAHIENTNFDTNATYTVDYKILATQAPQIGSIGCSYSQDISTAINNLQEGIDNRQEHDSILDEIVDLSLYEVITLNGDFAPCNVWGSTSYFTISIPFKVVKKVKPIVTINITNIKMLGGYFVPLSAVIIGGDSATYYDTSHIQIIMSTTNPTVVSYGATKGQLFGTITIDCRGRI